MFHRRSCSEADEEEDEGRMSQGSISCGVASLQLALPSKKSTRKPACLPEVRQKSSGPFASHCGPSKNRQKHGHSSISTGAGGGTLDSRGWRQHERDRAAATATKVSAQAKLRLELASAIVTLGTFTVFATISVALLIAANAMYFIFITGLVVSTIHHLGQVE
ncbi:hypothetical protein MTO96_009619 [Rhipicephalus appendiculatus]